MPAAVGLADVEWIVSGVTLSAVGTPRAGFFG